MEGRRKRKKRKKERLARQLMMLQPNISDIDMDNNSYSFGNSPKPAYQIERKTIHGMYVKTCFAPRGCNSLC